MKHICQVKTNIFLNGSDRAEIMENWHALKGGLQYLSVATVDQIGYGNKRTLTLQYLPQVEEFLIKLLEVYSVEFSSKKIIEISDESLKESIEKMSKSLEEMKQFLGDDFYVMTWPVMEEIKLRKWLFNIEWQKANDHKSNVMNPNNDAFFANLINRANQLNLKTIAA